MTTIDYIMRGIFIIIIFSIIFLVGSVFYYKDEIAIRYNENEKNQKKFIEKCNQNPELFECKVYLANLQGEKIVEAATVHGILTGK